MNANLPLVSKSAALVLCAMALVSRGGLAQVTIDERGVRVGSGSGSVAVAIGSGNTASNSSGGIGEDVEMEGVAVINGEVFIDGEKVPQGKTRHTGKKSGKKYRIQWGKGGNVAVNQE